MIKPIYKHLTSYYPSRYNVYSHVHFVNPCNL